MASEALPPNPPFPGRSTESQTAAQLPTRPPKSKTQPYYSISPLWSDIEPIPQIDTESVDTYSSHASPAVRSAADRLAAAGPPLASIAYAPRYSEAMAYLRAVMAKNEFSKRTLSLTEDVISMNAAHYTVWIYRMRILRHLWGVGDMEPQAITEAEAPAEQDQRVIKGVMDELQWLESWSERNLKNYQIWHHRTALVSLLPFPPPGEQSFLASILALDTKNYHVWSYRQWLCSRFPSLFLTASPSTELEEMDIMIDDDVYNNSAWNHRFFLCFGWRELQAIGLKNRRDQQVAGRRRQEEEGTTREARVDTDTDGGVPDESPVAREIQYVQTKIRLAPQNGSTWNYLRGILKHASIPVGDIKTFCAEFVGSGFDFTIENRPKEGVKGVTSSKAVEMLVDIFAAEVESQHAGSETVEDRDKAEAADKARKEKVRAGLSSLSEKWDPIRRRYWEYKLRGLEAKWEKAKEDPKA